MEIGRIAAASQVRPLQNKQVEVAGPGPQPMHALIDHNAALRVEPSAASRPDSRPESGTRSGRYVVDARTNLTIFQHVDERTGEVVLQQPDEAMLRRREYERQLEQARVRAPVADRTV
jgi:hypothetical protein